MRLLMARDEQTTHTAFASFLIASSTASAPAALTRDNLARHDAISQMNPAGISEDGWEWFKLATDPFHDRQVKHVGLPDATSVNTVVLKIQKSITLAPAPAGTWCAHIYFLPDGVDQNMVLGTRSKGYYTQGFYNGTAESTCVSNSEGLASTGTEAGTARGGFVVEYWTTDVTATTGVFPDGSHAYANGTNVCFTALPETTTFVPNQPAIASQLRVIGGGFEVVNTTADIYKQGTITVSRIPNVTQLTCSDSIQSDNTSAPFAAATGAAGATWYGVPRRSTTLISSGPPGTIEQAMAYTGSAQWPAARGAYCVLTQDPLNNQLASIVPMQRAYLCDSTTQTAPATVPTGFFAPHDVWTSAAKVLQPQGAQNSLPLNFDVSSCILSGLSSQTTLTVNMVYYVEFAPRVNDPGIGTLAYAASPSPQFDPAVIELYQRTIKNFPAGVPQDMNPLGEWWSFIASAAKSILPEVVGVVSDFVLPGSSKITRPAARVLIGGQPLQQNTQTKSVGKAKPAKPKKKGKVVKTVPLSRAK